MRHLGLIDPPDALSILPLALSNGLIFDGVPNAGAMLEVVDPLTDVFVATGELLRAFALHLAGDEVAFVSRLIWPDHDSFALHLVALKLAFVKFASLSEVVFACAVELTI